LVIQFAFEFFDGFSVLISLSDEKRSLVVPPPLVTQLSPADS